MPYQAPEWMTAAWVVANLVTGLSYCRIPIELWRWTRGLPLHGMEWVAALLGALIVAGGAHHLILLRMAGSHPVDAAQLATDGTMAVVSTTSVWLLCRLRLNIRASVRRLSALSILDLHPAAPIAPRHKQQALPGA